MREKELTLVFFTALRASTLDSYSKKLLGDGIE